MCGATLLVHKNTNSPLVREVIERIAAIVVVEKVIRDLTTDLLFLKPENSTASIHRVV
jgi:hypothetical protein